MNDTPNDTPPEPNDLAPGDGTEPIAGAPDTPASKPTPWLALGIGAMVVVAVVAVVLVMVMGGQSVSGDFAIAPQECPSDLPQGLRATMLDEDGKELGAGPMTIATVDGSCHVSFSFPVETADSYTMVFSAEGEEDTEITTFTHEDLEAMDWQITEESLRQVSEGARGDAQDKLAQSNLRNAAASADVYFTDDDTYAGFDAAAGADIEPSLQWVDGDDLSSTAPGAVGVAYADDNEVTLVAVSETGTGYCYAKVVTDAGSAPAGNYAMAEEGASSAITNAAACAALPLSW